MNSLERFREQFVLVIGDMILDKYIIGSVDRISPEAPIPVLRQTEVRRKLGGGGNVVHNAASLGARVRVVGRIGDDSEGRFFRDIIRSLSVDDRYLFNNGNTIVKTRVTAHNQQFIRIDDEIIMLPNENIKREVGANLNKIMKDITVVIISDYAKGFISEDMVQVFIKTAKSRKIPVLVDPKGKSAEKYRGATALTPNNREFCDMTGFATVPNDKTITDQAIKLCRENDYDYLIFTRSEKGISIIDRAKENKCDYPAIAKEVIDVTGAGDTVVAVIALAMGSGFDIGECAKIANMAASHVISKFGSAQVTIEELSDTMYFNSKPSLETGSIIANIRNLRNKGKKIVFTNGCFDLLHAGHVSSFKQAKTFGDVLVVGVNSDDSIRRIKGKTRPIVGLKDRIDLLATLECVDYVIPFDDDTPQALIEQIRPDVLVKGEEWQGKEVAGADFVISLGGCVKFIKLEQGLSTTAIIERIESRQGIEIP